MAIIDHVIGTGMSTFAAGAVVGGVTTLTAAGNSLATATLIPGSLGYFSVVSSGKGGSLPLCSPGSSVYVYNGGSNSLAVYPNLSTEAIANGSAGAAFTVAANKGCDFKKLTATQWGINYSA